MIIMIITIVRYCVKYCVQPSCPESRSTECRVVSVSYRGKKYSMNYEVTVEVWRSHVAWWSQPRARAKSKGIGERTRRQSTRNVSCAPVASHASRSEKKCHIINFMRYSTFAEPGPMHGPRGKPSMRVRRENFHIISPSPTRGPAGHAAFPVYRLVATVLWYGVRCVCVVCTCSYHHRVAENFMRLLANRYWSVVLWLSDN